MQDILDVGPVELSYAAALRGKMPHQAGSRLRYGLVGHLDTAYQLALAASNPEVDFCFFCSNPTDVSTLQTEGDNRTLNNLTALPSSYNPTETVAKAAASQPFDLLVIDMSALLLLAAERASLLSALPNCLSQNGLLALRYRPFNRLDDGLNYLIQTFGPAVAPASTAEFMSELQALATRASQRSRAIADLLARHAPRADLAGLMAAIPPATIESQSMVVQQAMLASGMHYLGEGKIADNYLEISVPAAAQEQLLKLRDTPHYEACKDLATDRLVRCDLWCRTQADFSTDPTQLLARFTFGSQGQRPNTSTQLGTLSIDLQQPIFKRMLAMMAIMPLRLDDCQQDSELGRLPTADLAAALQILVAIGQAAPMRDSFAGGEINGANPIAAGSHNQALLQIKNLPAQSVPLLASTVIGRPVRLDLKDYLVLQAITQESGLSGSAHILHLLLNNLANDPVRLMTLLGGQNPSPEIASQMIESVCNRDFISWYGYGLLAA